MSTTGLPTYMSGSHARGCAGAAFAGLVFAVITTALVGMNIMTYFTYSRLNTDGLLTEPWTGTTGLLLGGFICACIALGFLIIGLAMFYIVYILVIAGKVKYVQVHSDRKGDGRKPRETQYYVYAIGLALVFLAVAASLTALGLFAGDYASVVSTAGVHHDYALDQLIVSVLAGLVIIGTFLAVLFAGCGGRFCCMRKNRGMYDDFDEKNSKYEKMETSSSSSSHRGKGKSNNHSTKDTRDNE